MLSKTVPLLLIIASAMALMPMKPHINVDRSLVDIMLHGRAIGNPTLNKYCFDRYLPILKDIGDQFEADYAKCTDTYDAECSAIDAKYQGPRNNSILTARQTCDVLLKCESNVTNLDVLDCFASTSPESSKVLSSLGADAVEYASIARELYRNAEVAANFCANYAERVYRENTDKVYEELTDCLDGNIQEPASTRPTNPPTTEVTNPETSEVTIA